MRGITQDSAGSCTRIQRDTNPIDLTGNPTSISDLANPLQEVQKGLRCDFRALYLFSRRISCGHSEEVHCVGIVASS